MKRFARNVEVSELPHIGEGLIMGMLDLADLGFQLRTEKKLLADLLCILLSMCLVEP